MSLIFIDTAMTVPGTAVNQRNCRGKHSKARHHCLTWACHPTRIPLPSTNQGGNLEALGLEITCTGEHRTLPVSVWLSLSLVLKTGDSLSFYQLNT